MNLANAYLQRHGERLGVDRIGDPAQWATVQVTPRFRTSAHVVFLFVDRRTADPKLVMKVARFPAGGDSLKHEAESLESVQAARPSGFDSIPRVLSCTTFNGAQILLETGLAGRKVTERVVHQDFDHCRDAIVTWVTDLHSATLKPAAADGPDAFDIHAAGPLATMARWFPDDRDLLQRTSVLLQPLRSRQLQRVFEHGDLSAPNLLLDAGGKLQVVDWELASTEGVPACDLFFGLNYLAVARGRGRTRSDSLATFKEAFFGADAWATPLVRRYQAALDLGDDVMRSLFVLCWLRYAARLVDRLPGSSPTGVAGTQAREWLRRNRYFELWQESIRASAELFGGSGGPREDA